MNVLAALHRRRWLVIATAGLAAAVAGPGVAAPKSSDPAQQAQVKVGMSKDEVTQLIGKPVRTRKFSKGVTTWGYSTRKPETWFLVDISDDGRVVAVEERFVPGW